jgi:hypothetical protein
MVIVLLVTVLMVEIPQGGLIEPRSALLYQLLTVKGNKGKLPARFQDIVFKPWVRK